MRSLILSLFLATPALAEAPTVPIDDSFVGIGYSLEAAGSVEVYAAQRDVGGKLGICGFVVMNKMNATGRAIEKRATHNIAFWLGDTPLSVQTDRFLRYKSEDELKASPKAACVATQAPWQKGLERAKLKMELSNGEIRF